MQELAPDVQRYESRAANTAPVLCSAALYRQQAMRKESTPVRKRPIHQKSMQAV